MPRNIIEIDDFDGHGNPQHYRYFVHTLNENPLEEVKVFLLPNKPADLQELGKTLPANIACYHKASGKAAAGSNYIGDKSGFYKFYYAIDDEDFQPNKVTQPLEAAVYFKQDSHKINSAITQINYRKVIAEFVAGQLMDLLIGDMSAPIIFINSKPGLNPNSAQKNNDGIYIGSVVLQGGEDLNKVIDDITQTKHKRRPKFAGTLNHDWLKVGMLENGKSRFKNFEKTVVSSILISDFDVHTENFSVINKKSLARFDYGGALRNMDDDIHMHSRSRHLPIRGLRLNKKFWVTQPTNHAREFPRALRTSPAFAEELLRVSALDPTLLKDRIQTAMQSVLKYFDAEPIKEFVLGLGIKYISPNINTPTALATLAGDILFNKLCKRQQSMQKLAVDIMFSMCFKKNAQGKHEINPKAPYKVEDLVSQYPDYFSDPKNFHFRQADQRNSFAIPLPKKGQLKFSTSLIQTLSLKPLAQQAVASATVKNLQQELGSELINPTKRYNVTSYYPSRSLFKPKAKAPNLPSYLKRVVVSAQEFQTHHASIAKQNQQLTANFTAKPFTKLNSLQADEYVINYFSDAANIHGKKPYFIERLTKDGVFHSTAHQFSESIDKVHILCKTLAPYLKSLDMSHLKRHCHAVDMASKSSIEAFINKVAVVNPAEIGDVTSTLTNAYRMATYQTDQATAATIPCDGYLKMTYLQCKSFIERFGGQDTIGVQPDSNEALKKSYLLICHAQGWAVKNLSGTEILITPEEIHFTKQRLAELDKALGLQPLPPTISLSPHP